ncbi:mariner Mos1 transposase [Trichonephila clavipes]|nr:mariner Mos1 transposase [Trichonephila clavipes]
MSNFKPSDHDLRTALIFCYHLKKNAAESHQMLVEGYGANALSRVQCYRGFEKFQNGDFDSYIHRIVTGDEKWIYIENPKRNRSYVDPGKPSKSTARPNRFGRKTMMCIFWDQEGPIYYELLKPSETVHTDPYKQELLNLNDSILEKREQYKKRQHKVIFFDDNAPNHRAKPTKDIVKALDWEPLAHAAYSPDLAPSDYHLFASLGHALADQRFTSYENVKSWLDDWLASKDRSFFWRGFHKLPKCVASDGYHFK